jgi:hypothetical protein
MGWSPVLVHSIRGAACRCLTSAHVAKRVIYPRRGSRWQALVSRRVQAVDFGGCGILRWWSASPPGVPAEEPPVRVTGDETGH